MRRNESTGVPMARLTNRPTGRTARIVMPRGTASNCEKIIRSVCLSVCLSVGLQGNAIDRLCHLSPSDATWLPWMTSHHIASHRIASPGRPAGRGGTCAGGGSWRQRPCRDGSLHARADRGHLFAAVVSLIDGWTSAGPSLTNRRPFCAPLLQAHR